jgi:hypothetical protein
MNVNDFPLAVYDEENYAIRVPRPWLACDAVETVLDERGQPVSRWDGVTTKPHPVTGEPVPDENERLPLQRYLNPR